MLWKYFLPPTRLLCGTAGKKNVLNITNDDLPASSIRLANNSVGRHTDLQFLTSIMLN